MLIGTWKDGLYRYCIKENTFLHYPPLDEENSVLALFQDSRGVMWIGTSGSGLYKAHFSSDRNTVSFEGYRHDARNVSSLPSDYVYSIHEDLQTRSLWLGTREGVSVMELADEGKFINYQESGSKHYLPVREVNTVFRDRSGLMWIGTKGAGVFHVDTRKRSFHVIYPRGNDKSFTDLISTLYVEENGALWIGMGYGLDYQHGDKKVTLFPSKRPYHISYSPLTREVLLAVHDEGMIVCRDGQIIHQYKTSNCGFVPHDLVYLVHEDRKGNRWLCTYKGLGVRYRDGREYCFNRLSGADELLGREMTTMVEDNDGSLWLATNNNGIVHVTGIWNVRNRCSVRTIVWRMVCCRSILLFVFCWIEADGFGSGQRAADFVYMMCKMIVSNLFIRSLICPEIWLAACRKIIVVICGWAPIKGWQS